MELSAPIMVDLGVVGRNAGKRRRGLDSGAPLGHPKIRLADHPDLAGAPVLVSNPFDRVVEIRLLLRPEVLPDPLV